MRFNLRRWRIVLRRCCSLNIGRKQVGHEKTHMSESRMYEMAFWRRSQSHGKQDARNPRAKCCIRLPGEVNDQDVAALQYNLFMLRSTREPCKIMFHMYIADIQSNVCPWQEKTTNMSKLMVRQRTYDLAVGGERQKIVGGDHQTRLRLLRDLYKHVMCRNGICNVCLLCFVFAPVSLEIIVHRVISSSFDCLQYDRGNRARYSFFIVSIAVVYIHNIYCVI